MGWDLFTGLLPEDQPLAKGQRAELFDAFEERLQFDGEVDSGFMTRAKETGIDHEWVRWKLEGETEWRTNPLRQVVSRQGANQLSGSNEERFLMITDESRKSVVQNAADVLSQSTALIDRITLTSGAQSRGGLLSTSLNWNIYRVSTPYHQWVRALNSEISFVGGNQKTGAGATWATAKTNFIGSSETGYNDAFPNIVASRSGLGYNIEGRKSLVTFTSAKVEENFSTADLAIVPSAVLGSSHTRQADLIIEFDSTPIQKTIPAGAFSAVFVFDDVDIESAMVATVNWAGYDNSSDLDDHEPIDIDDTEQSIASLQSPAIAGSRRLLALRPTWQFPYDPGDFT